MHTGRNFSFPLRLRQVLVQERGTLSNIALPGAFLSYFSGLPISRKLSPGSIQAYIGFSLSRVQLGHFHALLEFDK